jgi:hypothetical protein
MLSARVDFNVGVELADVVDTCLVVRYEISAVVSSNSLTHLLIEKDKMKEASLSRIAEISCVLNPLSSIQENSSSLFPLLSPKASVFIFWLSSRLSAVDPAGKSVNFCGKVPDCSTKNSF